MGKTQKKYVTNDVLLDEISDLYSSIRDGRHREQKTRALSNLQSHQFLYCIEGSMCKFNDMRKKENAVS